MYMYYSRYTNNLQESAVIKANTFHRQQSTVNRLYWVTKVAQNKILMHSLGTKFISTAYFTSHLFTLKSAIHGTSQARHFYRFLLFKHHRLDIFFERKILLENQQKLHYLQNIYIYIRL